MTDESEAVDRALDNLNEIKNDNSGGVDRPEWMESSRSNSGGMPKINDGRHSFDERRVRDYMVEWYENETPSDFEVDLSEIEITVTGRLKKAHGRYKVKRSISGEEEQIRISKNTIDEHGWEEAKRTIRHEVVHAWQYQNDKGLSHGPSFRRWLEPFDIDVYAEDPAEKNPKYEIICPNCGTVDTKTRACKMTKNVELYQCRCGSQDLRVQQNH